MSRRGVWLVVAASLIVGATGLGCADVSGLNDFEFMDGSAGQGAAGGGGGEGGEGGSACEPDPMETLCASVECGTITDNCGNSVECPSTCQGTSVCGAGGVMPNQCGCTGSPNTTPDPPDDCTLVAGLNGGSFYFCSINNLDFEEARAYCQAFGTDLPVITSPAENEIFKANVTTNVHLGLYDPSECKEPPPACGEDRFEWVNGTPVVFDDWGSVEPNNTGLIEHCTEVSSATLRWNDIPCASIRGVVCETTCPN